MDTQVKQKDIWILINSAQKELVLFLLRRTNLDIVKMWCTKLPKDPVLFIWILRNLKKHVEEETFLSMAVNAAVQEMIVFLQLQDVRQVVLW